MSGPVDRLATALELLDASTEWIAVKDLSGHFVAANRAFAQALRADRARLRGLRNEDFFGSDAGADLSACEHLALLAGEAVERQLDVSLDGEPRTLRVVCTPWMDAGACAGLVLACSIDAGGSAESDRTLHTYAGAVAKLAHRFNNALTTVMGLADWHLVAETHAPPLRSDLEKIRSAAQQAEQTAREIQQLTRQAAASLMGQSSSVPPEPATSIMPDIAPAVMRRPVLLVDDEPSVRASLTVMIRTLGHEVHAVGSAAEAMAWLANAPAGVLLTDLEMPGTTGTELAAQAHSRWPELSVILMTGWATGGDELPPHVAAILPKPLRMAQLRQVLERL